MLKPYKWLEQATAQIRFRPDRESVSKELLEHIQDLASHFQQSGMEEADAETAALEAMGDPNAIAEDLGRIHKPWLGYLWRFSQGLLFTAAGLCCILCAQAFFRHNTMDLPGAGLYDYLTWEFVGYVGDFYEAREIAPGASVTTGGYTIRVDRASLRHPTPEERWFMEIDFHIDTGWRGEELYWAPNTIREIRDSTGLVHAPDTDHWYEMGSSKAVWGLGQKAGLWLDNVPADAEWVELDIGYGKHMRTLRIDLTKEAES